MRCILKSKKLNEKDRRYKNEERNETEYIYMKKKTLRRQKMRE